MRIELLSVQGVTRYDPVALQKKPPRALVRFESCSHLVSRIQTDDINHWVERIWRFHSSSNPEEFADPAVPSAPALQQLVAVLDPIGPTHAPEAETAGLETRRIFEPVSTICDSI